MRIRITIQRLAEREGEEPGELVVYDNVSAFVLGGQRVDELGRQRTIRHQSNTDPWTLVGFVGGLLAELQTRVLTDRVAAMMAETRGKP